MRKEIGSATIFIATALLASACGEATGPGRATTGPPLVTEIGIRLPVRAGGILHAWALPADSSYRLPHGEYALLVATSSAGEWELVQLRPFVCDIGFVCHQFTVYMQEGRDVSGIEAVARGLNARLFFTSGRVGGGHAFGNLRFTMDSIRRTRGVQSVERAGLLTGGGPNVFDALLAGALPFELGTPKPRSGAFSALPGDTVWLTYIQPTAGVVSFQEVLHLSDY